MKIIASDFDDTLYLKDNSVQTNKNIESINNFISKGNLFIIITGRSFSNIKVLLNELSIPYSYLICEDGAKIFNNMDYCIDTILLDRKTIEQIIPILEENNCDYYLDDGYNKTEYVVKIVVNCTDEQEKNRIVQVVKEKVNIHIYASRTHVNIINKTVNKENALKKLFNLEELNFDLLSVIGDNDNDYEMLKAFKGAVIKKHHPILDELNKDEYETLSDYIESLM